MTRSYDWYVGDSDSSKNNESYVARVGAFGQQYTDPLYWIFGDKYTDQLVEWADKGNKFFSKIAKQDPIGPRTSLSIRRPSCWAQSSEVALH